MSTIYPLNGQRNNPFFLTRARYYLKKGRPYFRELNGLVPDLTQLYIERLINVQKSGAGVIISNFNRG